LQINYELRPKFSDFYPLRRCFFAAPANSLTAPGGKQGSETAGNNMVALTHIYGHL